MSVRRYTIFQQHGAAAMKRWSPTGGVFSVMFLVLAIWCLIAIARGNSDPMWIFSFLTLPMSYVVVLLGVFVHSHFGLPDGVLGWSGAVLDVLWGTLMFYFFGWLLERPLKR